MPNWFHDEEDDIGCNLDRIDTISIYEAGPEQANRYKVIVYFGETEHQIAEFKTRTLARDFMLRVMKK